MCVANAAKNGEAKDGETRYAVPGPAVHYQSHLDRLESATASNSSRHRERLRLGAELAIGKGAWLLTKNEVQSCRGTISPSEPTRKGLAFLGVSSSVHKDRGSLVVANCRHWELADYHLLVPSRRPGLDVLGA
jgi:hypothetical protein